MKNKYLQLLLVSNALIVIDQITKFLVTIHVPMHYSIRVIDGFFSITHIRNPGVAFGLFAGQESDYKVIFFIMISTIAIAAILVIFNQTPDRKRMVRIGLILIFSGAIGNLIDRILYKEVIDFLDFYYQDFHWPAFNVADSCITVGVGLMIVDLFFNSPEGSGARDSSSESLPG
ncbi:lipoprotein signal peptidase [Candidatus Nitromaritima sp. SCGC AAA799-C22]|nr:lipoprotein signal peptidase [Candidatus Nitromaritima sp. SCGC AAA799-C22]